MEPCITQGELPGIQESSRKISFPAPAFCILQIRLWSMKVILKMVLIRGKEFSITKMEP